MTVKFQKTSDFPITVYPSGFGWVGSNDKEHRDSYVSISQEGQSISISAADVPALVKALEQAVAEDVKRIDRQVAESRRMLLARTN